VLGRPGAEGVEVAEAGAYEVCGEKLFVLAE
jgi:hypothetical protein